MLMAYKVKFSLTLTFYLLLQADNQIFGGRQNVLLFLTPPKKDVRDSAPALQFSAHKMPDDKWNADIYTVNIDK